MDKRKAWLGIAAGVWISVSVGCGRAEPEFETRAFTEQDMCVVKSEESEPRICYKVSREDAERAIGSAAGEDSLGGVTYEGGIRVFYREDQVAAIDLLEDSLGVYRTARNSGCPEKS
ncbi:hypothetical protein [Saccharibacillus brassicae]|uniref:Lipoprotein n=1 Tax=Saccharibacillus brassicae TaxID=2583377 RepID=A0A4Y6UW65_SACBS|nr:hypothetical protein [Saccharibacillus brassicae]QDH21992.1 hypothetical protein FFV09_14770 [Saccharibacillus brassicae]